MPAAAAARTLGRCAVCGVAITTASMSGAVEERLDRRLRLGAELRGERRGPGAARDRHEARLAGLPARRWRRRGCGPSGRPRSSRTRPSSRASRLGWIVDNIRRRADDTNARSSLSMHASPTNEEHHDDRWPIPRGPDRRPRVRWRDGRAVCRRHRGGARRATVVIEKGAEPGGSMRMSGGTIWTAPSMAVMETWVPGGDRERQRQLVDELAPGLAWLDSLGVRRTAPIDTDRQVGAEVDVHQLTERLAARSRRRWAAPDRDRARVDRRSATTAWPR